MNLKARVILSHHIRKKLSRDLDSDSMSWIGSKPRYVVTHTGHGRVGKYANKFGFGPYCEKPEKWLQIECRHGMRGGILPDPYWPYLKTYQYHTIDEESAHIIPACHVCLVVATVSFILKKLRNFFLRIKRWRFDWKSFFKRSSPAAWMVAISVTVGMIISIIKLL